MNSELMTEASKKFLYCELNSELTFCILHIYNHHFKKIANLEGSLLRRARTRVAGMTGLLLFKRILIILTLRYKQYAIGQFILSYPDRGLREGNLCKYVVLLCKSDDHVK